MWSQNIFDGVRLLKKCSQCKQEKEPNAFFKDARRASGLHSECKDCTKAAKRRWAVRNAPYTREYARKYYDAHAEERKERHRAWLAAQTPMALYKRYFNATKTSARKAVYYAIKTGKLVRQPCQVCGDPKTEAHHEDYSRKLDVTWVCRKHHGFVHRKDLVLC